ncbi:radical SAM family heme chaperone HemW [Sphingobacterium oryzagri]|uniref:Heme chaperone HemW n=1 Tax=Sphingobacterium oryzagri TaxID=3025669 RepID=A0ABY7WHP3_9SPHI|nr:radical SAM family heme chaperone HemW [Sphingobacterium sp. KACC 22765]WDF69141.1 radical SAM family heme chaperone HemW [Sphingobacterium sp. KACC 22765]
MIYFHIPFCKQACHYCDFHFSTSLKHKDDMLQALGMELDQRKSYLTANKVASIYFGGGTPSLLEAADIDRLIDRVASHFEIAPDAEITLEANPDDLNKTKVKALCGTAINRFSIGIQSFYEEDLRWMNRAHNADEAESAIKRVQDAGFENITADLIYGYPLLSDEKWRSNIQKLLDFAIPHISSYAMTVEHKTALAHFIKQGKTVPMDEAQSAAQMSMLIEMLVSAGFDHYEISNFAKQGQYAKHNTNYWRGVHYLGIGPSAHSFNGVSRSWNVANNAQYIRGIYANEAMRETEQLSNEDRINEYIMTALRTMWGIDLHKVAQDFDNATVSYLKTAAQPFIERNQLTIVDDQHLRLTSSGKLLADHIASELFLVDLEDQ